jgi:hypothetical protein
MLGHTNVNYAKEHSPKEWQIPPGTPCVAGMLMDWLTD